MSLRAISQITQSYTSPLRPCMPTFKILTKLKLKILTGLIIGSLIITMTGAYIRVYIRSLIKGLISRKHDYSLCCGAAYFKQQLHPPYNQVNIIFMTLQLITTGRSKLALTPLYCRLILIKKQELANYILLLSSLLYFII